MSTTDMYVVDADGDIVHHAQFRNSHGGAAAVFSLLGAHYLGVDPFSCFDDGIMSRLEALAEDPSSEMDVDDRLVLLTTDDNVIVRRADVPRLADAFERFYAKWKAKREGYVFSIGAQAEAMRSAIEDPDVQGVCWNQTSVGDTWNERIPLPKDDDGVSGDGLHDEDCDVNDDDCDWGYNVNIHKLHRWLFDDPAERLLLERSAESR